MLVSEPLVVVSAEVVEEDGVAGDFAALALNAAAVCVAEGLIASTAP